MRVRLRSAAANRQQPSPDINITPLVDVCLVLLIIFMVVAPSIQEGAAVELPKVMAPDPKTRDVNAIDLTIALDGTVVLEKETIKANQLVPKLTALHHKELDRQIIIKLDQNMGYKKVRDLFKQVQDIGFKGVLLKVAERKKS
ncbi:MAG TPA: biopolymer transporter ExbD [Polyangiaceae bacterium]|nr:biopolymer transporter ExbD [Polyangiaceae bacterium]